MKTKDDLLLIDAAILRHWASSSLGIHQTDRFKRSSLDWKMTLACLVHIRMVKWKWHHFQNPINEPRIHLEPRLGCYYNVLKWGGAKLKPGRFAHSTFRRTKVILPMGAHRSWLSSSSLIFFHQQQQHGWGWFKPISQTERMIGVISASL